MLNTPLDTSPKHEKSLWIGNRSTCYIHHRILLHQKHENSLRLGINTIRHWKPYSWNTTRSTAKRTPGPLTPSHRDIPDWTSDRGRVWSTSIPCCTTHCSDVCAVMGIDTQNSLQCRNSFQPGLGQISPARPQNDNPYLCVSVTKFLAFMNRW